MADKQFFEFKLESDTTTEGGSLPFINDLFLDIINFDEVNPYYYSSGYKENLDHVIGEKSQKAKFGWTKALPYLKIKLWRYSGNNLVEDTTDYEITDAVFLDGVRYLMAIYDNDTKMKIFKQTSVSEFETCANNNYESPSIGNFVDISRYEYMDNGGSLVSLAYYPWSTCLDRKFTVAAWGKGPKKQTGSNGFMKVDLVAGHLFYYFYDSNIEINVAAGDYLYINEGPLSGQIVPLSGNTVVDGFNGVETIFAWTGLNLDEGSDSGISPLHHRVTYPTYGDILHFICSDGIIHLNYTGTLASETEYTRCGAMHTNTQNNTSPPAFVISSMINFRPLDNICLYDVSDGEVKYGLQGYLKFYFKASNSFFISNDFTDLHEFSDYIILLGPNKTGLAYPYIDPNAAGVVKNFYREIGAGYINRYSRGDDRDSFMLVTNKGLWKLELNAGRTTEGRFVITPERGFQMGPFITDITQYSRYLGDNIGISMEEKEFRMYITTEQGTIIWIKSVEHNYRRQHIIPNKVKGYSAGVFIGDGAYDRGGDAHLDSYLAFTFGDKSMMIPKNIHSLKLSMGRDSFINMGKTVLETNRSLSGRAYTMKYDDRSTCMWLREMMNLKNSGNEDAVYRTYENEIEIASGEGHGKPVPLRMFNKNKISAFNDYITAAEGNDITDFDDKYTLANRANMHLDLGYMCDVCTFRLISKGDNNVEFYGAQIRYDLTNEVGGSLDNSLVVKASLEDGSSPIVPK